MKRKSNHVYFNSINKETSMCKYKTGNFYSKKNHSNFTYRSGYEYAYFVKLEKDSCVINYVVEPFTIPYIDEKGKKRTYKPDIVVLRVDGTMEVIEIKPKAMLVNATVQRKASAAKSFLKRNFKNHIIEYKFITEEDIFSSYQEYLEVIKTIWV